MPCKLSLLSLLRIYLDDSSSRHASLHLWRGKISQWLDNKGRSTWTEAGAGRAGSLGLQTWWKHPGARRRAAGSGPSHPPPPDHHLHAVNSPQSAAVHTVHIHGASVGGAVQALSRHDEREWLPCRGHLALRVVDVCISCAQLTPKCCGARLVLNAETGPTVAQEGLCAEAVPRAHGGRPQQHAARHRGLPAAHARALQALHARRRHRLRAHHCAHARHAQACFHSSLIALLSFWGFDACNRLAAMPTRRLRMQACCLGCAHPCEDMQGCCDHTQDICIDPATRCQAPGS